MTINPFSGRAQEPEVRDPDLHPPYGRRSDTIPQLDIYLGPAAIEGAIRDGFFEESIQSESCFDLTVRPD